MPTRPPRRLSRHLWWWVLLSLMLVWATLVATAWYTGLHEAQEINEGRLDTVARLWMQDGEGDAPRPSRYGPEMMVLVWDDATLVHDSHGVASALQAQLDTILGSRSWRITSPLRAIARVVRGERAQPDHPLSLPPVAAGKGEAQPEDVALRVETPDGALREKHVASLERLSGLVRRKSK